MYTQHRFRTVSHLRMRCAIFLSTTLFESKEQRMSTTDNRKSHFRIQTDAYAKYIEDTISFNVKVMLAINGMNQTDLANALGLKRSTISVKLNGRISWSAVDLVRAAAALHTTPQALLNDTLMKQASQVKKNQ